VPDNIQTAQEEAFETEAFGPFEYDNCSIRIVSSDPIEREGSRDKILVSFKQDAEDDLLLIDLASEKCRVPDVLHSIMDVAEASNDAGEESYKTLQRVLKSIRANVYHISRPNIDCLPKNLRGNFQVAAGSDTGIATNMSSGLEIYYINLGSNKSHYTTEVMGADDVAKNLDKNALVWAIAVGESLDSSRLDELTLSRFGYSLKDIVQPGEKPRALFFDDIITVQIPIFEINPNDTTKVIRRPIQLIIGDHALLSIDKSDCGFLERACDEMEQHRLNKTHLMGAASLACHIISKSLEHNDEIMEFFERKIGDLEKSVAEQNLPVEGIKQQIPSLRRTLRYYHRKVGQISSILSALYEGYESNPGLFQKRDPEKAIINLKEKITALTTRAEHELQHLDDISRLYDTLQRKRIDSMVTIFTVFAGLAGPLVLVDYWFGRENILALIFASLVSGAFVIRGILKKSYALV